MQRLHLDSELLFGSNGWGARLLLHFEINNEMQRLVQNELYGRWSRTLKGWYLDDTPEMKNRIIAICRKRAWYNLREIDRHLNRDAKKFVHNLYRIFLHPTLYILSRFQLPFGLKFPKVVFHVKPVKAAKFHFSPV